MFRQQSVRLDDHQKRKKKKKDEKVKKELNLLNVWSSTFTLDYSMH